MATLVLSIVIFGGAGYIIYSKIKKGKSCSDCHTTCPVKKEQAE